MANTRLTQLDIGRQVMCQVEIHTMSFQKTGTVIEVYPFCFVVDFGNYKSSFPYSDIVCGQVVLL